MVTSAINGGQDVFAVTRKVGIVLLQEVFSQENIRDGRPSVAGDWHVAVQQQRVAVVPTIRQVKNHFMAGRGILPCIKDIAYHCIIPETFIFKYDMGEIGFPAGNARK